ncbi:MAG TPA: hypothetical protein VMD47_10205 [Candidatus Acidoferrales bacterium]|nr:hypothetical protein [Candidatus Acidoferrales bacterium]
MRAIDKAAFIDAGEAVVAKPDAPAVGAILGAVTDHRQIDSTSSQVAADEFLDTGGEDEERNSRQLAGASKRRERVVKLNAALDVRLGLIAVERERSRATRNICAIAPLERKRCAVSGPPRLGREVFEHVTIDDGSVEVAEDDCLFVANSKSSNPAFAASKSPS